MAMLEQDLEQLEQFLDGTLEPVAVLQLQARLNSDSELASALTELKSQRAVRSAVWQLIDPDSASAERLVWRIKGAMLNQERAVAVKSKFTWNSWRITSVSSAAAACVILGFMFGRVGHNNPTTFIPSALTSGETNGSALVQYSHPVQSPIPAQVVSNNLKAKISVPITDEYGQVVAWQTFDSPEEAKNFTEDLHKSRAQQSTPVPAAPRLVDQQQF